MSDVLKILKVALNWCKKKDDDDEKKFTFSNEFNDLYLKEKKEKKEKKGKIENFYFIVNKK